MKVSVDEQKCVGHGRCAALASEVFDIDDLGFSTLIGKGEVEVPSDRAGAAELGASGCPEDAISLSS